MAVTQIGTGISGTANTTITVATTQAVPAGKHLIALLGYNSDKATLAPSIADNSGGSHTWQEDDETSQSGNNAVMAFSTKAITDIPSGTNVTVTFTANASRKSLRLLLVDDLASTSWLIENGRATGSNAGSVSAATDAAVSGDIQFIAHGQVNTGANTTLAFTSGGSYAEIGSELVAGGSATRSAFAEERSVSGAASGTETATGTTDRTTGWAMILLAYRRAAAATAKDGGMTSAGSLGGSKGVFTGSSKFGGMLSDEALLGAEVKTVSFVKTGGMTSAARLGAAGQGGIARTGGFQSSATLSGTGSKVLLFSRSGGFVSASRSGGGKKQNAAGPWSQTFAFQFPTATAKSGGMTSPGVLGASKLALVTLPKSGGMTSAGTLGGSYVRIVSRSGGIVSAGTLGASKLVGAVKGAGTTSQASLGGTRAYNVPRTGGFTAPARLGGSAVVASANQKTGGMSSAARLGGPKIVTFAKTGGMSSAARVGGTRTHSYGKPGGILGAFTSSASRTYTVSRTNGFRSPLVIGGTSATTGITSKTGGMSSAARLGGTRQTVFSKSVSVVSSSSTGASKVAFKLVTRTGGTTSAASTGASKLWSVTNTGGFRSAARLGGFRLGFNVQGGFTSSARLGGTHAITQTIPTTGRKHSIVSARLLEAKLIGAKVDA